MHTCTQALEHDIHCNMFHVLHFNLVSLLSKISAGWVTQILGVSTYLCLGTCGGGVALPVVLKILPNEIPESIS